MALKDRVFHKCCGYYKCIREESKKHKQDCRYLYALKLKFGIDYCHGG